MDDAATTPSTCYVLARTAIDRGYPEIAAAAAICFEWLQRPIGGYIRWTDYRGKDAPTAIRIFHHKTGADVRTSPSERVWNKVSEWQRNRVSESR
jgi:hypothetical protein